MIAPVRFLHPTEVKVLKARHRALGEGRIKADLIKAGWSEASAEIIAGVLVRDTEVNE